MWNISAGTDCLLPFIFYCSLSNTCSIYKSTPSVALLLFRSSWLDFQCQPSLALHGAQRDNKQAFGLAPTSTLTLCLHIKWLGTHLGTPFTFSRNHAIQLLKRLLTACVASLTSGRCDVLWRLLESCVLLQDPAMLWSNCAAVAGDNRVECFFSLMFQLKKVSNSFQCKQKGLIKVFFPFCVFFLSQFYRNMGVQCSLDLPNKFR